jgi:serine/threonine-protein kinase
LESNGPVTRLEEALAGRYRIDREIGAGGMATVYLAEDLRHQRKVALKVLHPELAALLGTDRFLAEITTTATLQHPSILPLFDSGVADGAVFYVMPYMRGESLRARLDRERQLPLDDAIQITTSVAQALDYAHRQGVIHRDIKPENILLQDGHALVADFGIALAVSTAGGARLTQTGLSVGTPQYMSPEQAAAERTFDARTDVYSLGAVCYEMIAGEPPFSAPTAQGVIARVLSEEPKRISSLRRSVSPALEAAVHRALEKTPADRWRSASEFADALSHADALPGAARTHARGRYSPALLIGALSLGVILGAFVYRGISGAMAPSTTVVAPVRHWAIPLPDSSPFTPTVDEYAAPRAGVAISRDGSVVAYVGRRGSTTALHLVRLVGGTVTPLDGTEGARLPVFSPDGRWLAFIAQGELRKIPVDGGAVVRLGPVEAPTGLFWMSDERLLVSRSALGPGTVPATGGRLERLGDQFRASSFVHTQLLPGGKFLLGTTAYGDLATISLETGAFRFITTGASGGGGRAEFGGALRGRNPQYISSGHLLYASGSSLMAVSFDLRTLRATGKPTPLAADVRAEGGPGESHFAVSDEGTLVYAPGLDGSNGSLVWVDQRGVGRDTLPLRAGATLAFRLSRDGRKLALVERLPNAAAETRIADLVRRVEAEARLEGEFAVTSWSGNGRGLVGFYVPDTAQARACCFSGAELDATTLALQVTSTASAYHTLIRFDESPDGSLRCDDAVRTAGSNRTGLEAAEVLLLRPRDNRVRPREVVAARVQGDCTFSPDGTWLAYTNRDGLFVTRATLDSTAQTFKLVPGVTSQARWMPNGKAIVYRNGRALFTVDVRIAGDAVDASEPRLLFQRDGLFTTWDVWGNGWDVGRDGRLLVWQEPAQSPAFHLKVITNLGKLAAERVGAEPSK